MTLIVIFDKFCNPSFIQCHRKINIKLFVLNISTEVIVSFLKELQMKENANSVVGQVACIGIKKQAFYRETRFDTI